MTQKPLLRGIFNGCGMDTASAAGLERSSVVMIKRFVHSTYSLDLSSCWVWFSQVFTCSNVYVRRAAVLKKSMECLDFFDLDLSPPR